MGEGKEEEEGGRERERKSASRRETPFLSTRSTGGGDGGLPQTRRDF